jgi:hypothetical protein
MAKPLVNALPLDQSVSGADGGVQSRAWDNVLGFVDGRMLALKARFTFCRSIIIFAIARIALSALVLRWDQDPWALPQASR